MSKIALSPDANGTGVFTIASPNSDTSRTLTLPDDSGTIVTNSGNQAGSFTTLNTSGQVVFNDAGADVDFRVEGDTDANLLFVDASADAVGIGASPSEKLSVVNNGTAQISITNSSGTTKNTQLMFKDNAGSKWRIGMDVATNNNTNIFQIYNDVATAASMSIDSSGNVGIGTTTTSGSILNIVNSVANDELTFRGTAYTSVISESTGGMDIKLTQSAPMLFYTNNTERLRIDSSGNLLVGGTLNNSYRSIFTLTSANNVTDVLALHNGSNASGTGTGARLLFKLANFENAVENRKYASIEGISTASFNEAIALVFKTQASASGGDPVERMRINSSGYAQFSGGTGYNNSRIIVQRFAGVGNGGTMVLSNTEKFSGLVIVGSNDNDTAAYVWAVADDSVYGSATIALLAGESDTAYTLQTLSLSSPLITSLVLTASGSGTRNYIVMTIGVAL